MVGTPLVSRVLALLPLFSPLALPTYKSISRSDQLSTSLAGATHRCRASIRTLQGPSGGPVPVGVRSKAQVHHQGDGPGLLGAAIYAAISEGSARPTQSPEQGGGCHV